MHAYFFHFFLPSIDPCPACGCDGSSFPDPTACLSPGAGGLFQVPQIAAGPFPVPWRGAGMGSPSAPPAPSVGPVAKRQVVFTLHTHVYYLLAQGH